MTAGSSSSKAASSHGNMAASSHGNMALPYRDTASHSHFFFQNTGVTWWNPQLPTLRSGAGVKRNLLIPLATQFSFENIHPEVDMDFSWLTGFSPKQ